MRLPESSMAGPFLGALLQGARIPPEVSAEMFEYRRDQIIFTAISDMVKEGVTPDILTLTHYLQSAGKLDEAGGAAYVASLTDNAYIANIQYYADAMIKESRERGQSRAIKLANEKIDRREDVAEIVLQLQDDIARTSLLSDIKNRLGTWGAYIKECTVYQPEKDFKPALFAGLAFPNGTVSYVGARTGRGKTTAMVNIAREALTGVTPRKVVFITLEMSRKQILNKLILSTAYSLAAEGNDGEIFEKRDKPTDDLYRTIKNTGLAGVGSSEVWKYTKKALSIIESAYNTTFFLYDGRGASFTEIISAINTYGEPGAVILLDYIQRMPDAPGSATDTYMRVKKISDGVVTAAVKTDSVIISGAQFKRVTGRDTIGKADTFDDSSYRESGDLEQDAHNALGIGWEADKQGRFIEILKTREDKGAGKQYGVDFNGAYSYMAAGGMRVNQGKRNLVQENETVTAGRIKSGDFILG